ncbi:hypothetical protein [Burkholderia sp. PU8-34]
MIRIRVVSAVLAVAASIGLTLVDPPVAAAQDTTQAASVPMSASSAKQIRKAQRKAARKAARAKRNAELSTLEKNGYRMTGGNQNDYPENLQNAERKAAAAKAAAGGTGATAPSQ